MSMMNGAAAARIEKEGRLAKDFSLEMFLPEIATLMLNADFDVNLTTCSSGLPPLAHAASNGHDASVRLLLEDAPGINVNQANSTDGMTPLNMAALNGYETCVQLLLDAPGIKVNQADSTDGMTPLYMAALTGHETCVRL